MKKIIFRGLGPTGNVTYKDKDGKEKLIKDGAIVTMEKEKADAYIKARLAYEVVDENEARKIQNLIKENQKTREKVEKAAKKGGKK